MIGQIYAIFTLRMGWRKKGPVVEVSVSSIAVNPNPNVMMKHSMSSAPSLDKKERPGMNNVDV